MLAAVLGIFCVSGPVLGQNALPLAEQNADAQVLPIWNTQSGQLEALLLLPDEADDARVLSRVLPETRLSAGTGAAIGLDLDLNRGGRLHSRLQPETNTGLALLCNESVHVAMTLGPLAEQCLLARIGADEQALPGTSHSPGIALDNLWQSPGGALDLSFGLSWLDTPLHNNRPSPAQTGPALHATPATPPPLVLGNLQRRELHLGSQFSLDPNRRISLGGSLASHELRGALPGGHTRWDSTTITLGVNYHGLSGHLTGRLIEVPQNQSSFNGLDLGFSWRTPWQGELSFGAQNILNKTPDSREWPLHELPPLEVPGGRTPYVRYKQDL